MEAAFIWDACNRLSATQEITTELLLFFFVVIVDDDKSMLCYVHFISAIWREGRLNINLYSVLQIWSQNICISFSSCTCSNKVS